MYIHKQTKYIYEIHNFCPRSSDKRFKRRKALGEHASEVCIYKRIIQFTYRSYIQSDIKEVSEKK